MLKSLSVGLFIRCFICIRQDEKSCDGGSASLKKPADWYFTDKGVTKYSQNLVQSEAGQAAITNIFNGVVARSAFDKLETLKADGKYPLELIQKVIPDLRKAINTTEYIGFALGDITETYHNLTSDEHHQIQAIYFDINAHLKGKFNTQTNQKIVELVEGRIHDEETVPTGEMVEVLAEDILKVVAIESLKPEQRFELQAGINSVHIDGARSAPEVLNADVETGNYIISLEDKRQLYANRWGWVGEAHAGDHSNVDSERRIWHIGKDEDGIISLLDGRQLYTNAYGWLGVAHAGDHTNTDPMRRTWTTKKKSNSIFLRAPSKNHDTTQICLSAEGWANTNGDISHRHAQKWVFTPIDLQIGDRLRALTSKTWAQGHIDDIYRIDDIGIVIGFSSTDGEAHMSVMWERTGKKTTIGKYEWIERYKFEERTKNLQIGDKFRPLPSKEQNGLSELALYYSNSPVYTVTDLVGDIVFYQEFWSGEPDKCGAIMWSKMFKRERLESEMYHFVKRAFDDTTMKYIFEKMKKIHEETELSPDSEEAKKNIINVVTHLVIEECKRELLYLGKRYDEDASLKPLSSKRPLYYIDIEQNYELLLQILQKPLCIYDENSRVNIFHKPREAKMIRLRSLARVIVEYARKLAAAQSL